ncbi:MAG TPA: hypothetical protein P5056_02600 [Candidatus Paceibacterota bacterium]|nr:hypothetical protein [Candidatus Paceibacterota bacterium]
MESKELTPEKVMTRLTGKKKYFNQSRDALNTSQLRAYNRHNRFDEYQRIFVYLKIPKSCSLIKEESPECNCGSCRKQARERFESRYITNASESIYWEEIRGLIHKEICPKFDLHLGSNHDADDILTFNLPNGSATIAYVNSRSFHVDGFGGSHFARSRELALDLLKLYLKVYGKYCTW